jgi:CRISPR/Cas system CMR-associated protein Cmr5 small subunit
MNQPDLVFWGFQALIGTLCTVLFYIFKSLKAEVEENERKRAALNEAFQNYKLHVAETYVKNEDLSRMEGKIDKLFEKLDTKVDK